MKKVKVKIPAKINLTLDIEGVRDGYHVLESLVASVNIYDTVTIAARKENVISVTFSGIPAGVSGKNSNAYFAAEKFRKEFSTDGVDITIERGIPIESGLGGSSADIAGVLNGMQKLFRVGRDISHIADSLGSDVTYMLGGGYAVMRNRGEQVERLSGIKRKFYLIIVTATGGISTADCYREFDKKGKKYKKNTPIATKLLVEDDTENFLKTLKNDLFESAATLFPEIKETLSRLKNYGAAVMTGSGSAVYGVYTTKKARDLAYKALLPDFGARLLKAETL